MEGAQQHAFWKQRVYKEERERQSQYSRGSTGPIALPQTPMRVSIPQKSSPSPSYDPESNFLPPLKACESPNSRSPKTTTYSSMTSTSPMSNKGYSDRCSRTPSPSHVSYRPRGPPASLHGVNSGYHTFTYQGRAFLEDTSL
eukprot:TRINITY_DN3251_c0_g2_i1.p1 TRINITY_DN3251_c0_g2~~TRINITY_DN3251_c0_g2_i1.p1  ORF type:complete len:142 (+),score=18.69 TRINITY_DN3251_c0_g2_i1:87-512(+)